MPPFHKKKGNKNMIFKSKTIEENTKGPVETDAMHLVSFVGLERSDIVFYLAKILQERNTTEGYRTVLLVDNSDSKDLFYIVNKKDEEEVTMKRITFQCDMAYDPEYFNQFAFIIVYHGLDVDKEILEQSDMVVCSADYNPNNYKILSGILDGYTKDIQMIYRNWMNKKIKENLIENEIGIPNEQVEMRSIIKASLQDQNAYIQLLHNGNQRVNKSELSELMIETLKYLVEKITGVQDDKTLNKMISKAK